MALKFFFLILLSPILVQAEICERPILGDKAESSKRIFEKTLYQFASSKDIAPLADKTLSKLAKAQSPTIIDWGKKRNINPQTEPEKFAKEWRSYFATQFIIGKYPTKITAVDILIEQHFDNLLENLFTVQNKRYFEEQFTYSKKLAISKINNSPLSLETKQLILKKINPIKLYFPEKLRGSKYEKSILEFLNWGLAFDPINNEINLGLETLQYNEQNLRVAILHEIAHSFDTCRWSQSENSAWPFEKIGVCLRKFTMTRDDSRLDEFKTTGFLTESEYQFFKKNQTCHNTKYPPSGIQKDQITETFADWFSAYALENEKIDIHFRDDLCSDKVLDPGSSYLSNTDRLYKIYLSNKHLSSFSKKKSDEFRCTF